MESNSSKFTSSDRSSSHVVFPYYTNGGVGICGYNNFIDKLIVEGRTYCTKDRENVLVKYAYAPGANFDYPGTFASQKHVYCIPEIENFAEANRDTYPYINKITIDVPVFGYTCPAKTLMCFSSFKRIEDFSFIDKFHNFNTHEPVKNFAKEHNIRYKVLKQKDYYAILFDKTLEDIQPIC